MAAGPQQRKRRRDVPGSKARELLSHPWRVRIMEVLHNREMSVSQFVDEGLIPELERESREEAISLLSYHFRKLRRANLLEVVAVVPGRGSNERIYRAFMGVHHNDEDWADLSREERQAITPMTLSSLTGLAELAVLYGTFDQRVDRHLSWVPLELDERGWSELGPVLNGVLGIVLRIKDEAKARLEASGEQPVRAVFGQMLFESPPLESPDRA